MLSLESPDWVQLTHAYGSAGDIPDLLRQLETLPDSEGNKEPWFSIWSALAHQGDVYSASFAAVPHIVRVLSTAPELATFSFLQFPAWVEICRHRNNIEVPPALLPAYSEALGQLPALVGAAAARPWDEGFLRCALSAIAAAKGFPAVAEAALELEPEVAKEFMEWFWKR
jgi:hypothetical protein